MSATISDPRFARLLRGSRQAKERVIAEAKGVVASKPAEAPASASSLKLESFGDRWVGACPACQEEGGDSQGNHLVIFEGGAFGCVKHPGEAGKDHRSKMAKLCPALPGGKGGWKPTPKVDLSKEEKTIAKAYAALWKAVKKEFGGKVESLGESAPIPETPAGQFFAWCSLWESGELAWAGGRFDCDAIFRSHLFEPASKFSAEKQWEKIVAEGLDHASGVIWHPDATGRKKAFVTGHRLLIVEHDGEPIKGQVALIRYARQILGMDLRMVISTGGKGIHGIFYAGSLSNVELLTLSKTLTALGADPQSLGQSATRIPGATRQPHGDKPGGKAQSILWINPNL